ncbi:SDR family oxidoreductase [Brevibacterium album]|uniref:SDR family oxidoreductase n=1 Tax=Brevibacterium album TaxID=417948 RepID=UPI0004014C51|nr:SDR family oxidoreductase [Brevibacterium album]
MSMDVSALARDPFPLRGRAVLVTGVSRRAGIGYATACRAAAYGASVFCHHFAPHDAQQPWGGDDIAAVIAGVRAHAAEGTVVEHAHADLAEEGEPERLVRTASAALGGLDGLVCNQALSGSDGALGELTAEMLDRHWAVNARASILLAQEFARLREAARAQAGSPSDRGREVSGPESTCSDPEGTESLGAAPRLGDDASIVLLTSGQGEGPMPGEVAYAAAKAALAGITVTLADQLIDSGIRLNTVNPGPVDTGYVTEEMREATRAQFPLGRWGEPDDPARLIAWLLTDEARWITSQVLSTEGGFARWRAPHSRG